MPRPLPPGNISLLAEKLLNGTISSEELEVFNRWYNQFNDEELLLTSDDHSKMDGINRLMLREIQQRVRREEKPQVVYMRNKWWLAAAVVTGLLLGAGYFLSPNSRTVENIAHTTNDQQTKVILPDSSIVWLKPNSNIDYSNLNAGSERRVTLTGEALFEVTKNAEKPFVIQSGEYTVRVLGTSFNMRNLPNAPFQLTVLTGEVLVQKNLPNGNKEQHIIVPMQKITATDKKEMLLLATAPEENAQVSAGTEYMMNFQNVPFSEIAKSIERKFDVKCTIQSDLLLQCRLTANLTDQSLTRTLELIAASIHMNYEIKNGEVLVSGTGCE